MKMQKLESARRMYFRNFNVWVSEENKQGWVISHIMSFEHIGDTISFDLIMEKEFDDYL